VYAARYPDKRLHKRPQNPGAGDVASSIAGDGVSVTAGSPLLSTGDTSADGEAELSTSSWVASLLAEKASSMSKAHSTRLALNQ